MSNEKSQLHMEDVQCVAFYTKEDPTVKFLWLTRQEHIELENSGAITVNPETFSYLADEE